MPTPSSRPFRAGAIVLLAVFLASCDSNGSHAVGLDPSSGSSLQSKVDAIEAQVAALRGLSFLRPVKADWVGRSHLQALTDSLDRAHGAVSDTGGQGMMEEVFHALGYLDSAQSLSSSTDSFYGSQIEAFYYRGTDHLWVLADQASASDLESTIAHELTHALIDQNFQDTLADSVELDEAIAYQFLHEGEANYVADLWSIGNQTVNWTTFTQAYFLQWISSSSGLEAYPPVVLWPALTPYTCGESYARAAQLAGGWSALNDAHRVHPPSTTAEFRVISGDVAAPLVDWTTQASFPSMADRRSDEQGRLGEVYLDALVATWGAPLVTDWSGDRVWVWGADATHGTAVAGRTAWLSPAGASNFLSSWSRGMTRRVGPQTLDGTDSVEFRSTDSTRFARGVRQGSEVRVVWGDLRGGKADSLWADLAEVPRSTAASRALGAGTSGRGPAWKPPRHREFVWR
jgi:hypothetical protein